VPSFDVVRFRAAITLIGALCAGAAFAGESSGRVRVIDGDSIRMGRDEIRLQGVDAVEGDQTCRRANGEDWPCGAQARRALARLVAKQTVTCVHHGKDKYGRILGTCSLASGSINDWLVRQGWAVAYTRYSPEYVDAQAEAKAAKRNIWSGTFTKPERYRHQK
jgi:endonuclease YncB( thermonuclease family)